MKTGFSWVWNDQNFHPGKQLIGLGNKNSMRRIHFLLSRKLKIMERNEIKCIERKDGNNSGERPSHVGGISGDGKNWKQTTPKTIRQIEEYGGEFFVTRNFREVKVVAAVSKAGNKYLKTEADGYGPNNLLSLPECT